MGIDMTSNVAVVDCHAASKNFRKTCPATEILPHLCLAKSFAQGAFSAKTLIRELTGTTVSPKI